MDRGLDVSAGSHRGGSGIDSQVGPETRSRPSEAMKHVPPEMRSNPASEAMKQVPPEMRSRPNSAVMIVSFLLAR